MRYCRARARLWYSEGLSTGALSIADSLSQELVYYRWDRRRLSEEHVTEMPSKSWIAPRFVMVNSELSRSVMRRRRVREDAIKTMSAT